MVRVQLFALWAQCVLAQQFTRPLITDVPVPDAPLHPLGPRDVAPRDLNDCISASAVNDVCFSRPGFSTADPVSQANCLCCVGASNISPVYRGCATYASTALPTQTDLISANNLLSSICAAAGTAICAGGGGGSPSTTPRPTTGPTSASGSTRVTSSSRSQITYPVACTSLDNMILSCNRATPSFTRLPASSQVGCICYDDSGSFTTEFDRLATPCISYIRTANPTQYSSVSAWTTFCERRSPVESDSDLTLLPPSTRTTPRSTTTTTPNSGGGTNQPGNNNNPSTTSRSSAPAHHVAPLEGPLAWMTQAVTFVLSFFILI